MYGERASDVPVNNGVAVFRILYKNSYVWKGIALVKGNTTASNPNPESFSGCNARLTIAAVGHLQLAGL